jgi:hypothetical protein
MKLAELAAKGLLGTTVFVSEGMGITSEGTSIDPPLTAEQQQCSRFLIEQAKNDHAHQEAQTERLVDKDYAHLSGAHARFAEEYSVAPQTMSIPWNKPVASLGDEAIAPVQPALAEDYCLPPQKSGNGWGNWWNNRVAVSGSAGF